MKILSFVFAVILLIPKAFAVDAPLIIAVNNYAPPFVSQSANNYLFGFDISMMDYICKTLQRTCKYKPMPFSQILLAVQNKQADMAIGSIIITPERAKIVTFTQPYLQSMARFMGRKEMAGTPFNTNTLANKKIGVAANTVYPQVALSSGATPGDVIQFTDLESVVEALQNGDIDLALMDNPTAEYWDIHSSGSLIVLGKPFNYGFGLGIAVNKEDTVLLQQLNQALVQYQQSDVFKTDTTNYFSDF